MKKVLLLLVFSVILSGCSLPFLSSKKAALQVNADPQSSVFLNGNHVGQTPFFDENLKPGDYSVKIQSDSQQDQVWEADVTLNSQVVTVVSRKFGDTTEKSSSYIIQMESMASDNDTEVSIVTIPDNVIVKLDGQPEGFSPISLKDISEGDHTVTLSAPGYMEEVINVSVKGGYKMIISATLGRSQILPEPVEETKEATESAETAQDDEQNEEDADEEEEEEETVTPSPEPAEKDEEDDQAANVERPYVVILETGTGWLRVRSEPNASLDNELAKVDVGEKLPFIEANDTGWYLIVYKDGEEGWISGRYADLVR